ncbi:hypothetical protein PALB_35240 [Pseudoalteromonas luteoviolacea B = ATCC 29581]|nr:hypothetical protein PALB_35240 [Pseudoalteromonas luteoviolacea B = ATCC 29581]
MIIKHEQIKEAMLAWQQDIVAGNFAFEHGQFFAANRRYLSSLSQLLLIQSRIFNVNSFGENKLPLNWIADQYVPALMVSYLNMVDCSIAQNDAETACDVLVEGHLQLNACAFGLAQQQTSEDGYCLCEHISALKQQTYSFAQRFAHRPELIAKINHAMQIAPFEGQSIH